MLACTQHLSEHSQLTAQAPCVVLGKKSSLLYFTFLDVGTFLERRSKMSFIQSVFNSISLKKDPELWLSADDTKTKDRLQLIAKFVESQFQSQLSSDGPAIKICKKNPQLSSALREKANLCYAQGDCQAALGLYNQCLQFSSTEESATVFSNRSAVWADLEEWEAGIGDIDLALRLFEDAAAAANEEDQSSSKGKIKKLLERKALCLSSLGRNKEAAEALQDLIETFQGKGGNRNKSKLDQFTSWRKKLLQKEDSPQKIEKQSEQWKGINCLLSPHPRIPRFSDAVRVQYTPGQGRHCVAARDIEPGELIAEDHPYVWMLDKSECRSLCWHCFEKLKAPIPCKSCAGVLFCSTSCMC